MALAEDRDLTGARRAARPASPRSLPAEPPELARGSRVALVSIAVVDDDAIVRGWVRGAFEDTEFRVGGEAATAAEGRAMIGRRRSDLLLLDYQLPDRSGTELLRELRRSGNSAPAVIMTAAGREGLNEAAREAGAQGTVVKATDSAWLLRVLRAVLGGGELFDIGHPRRPERAGTLTTREREIIALVAAGATNEGIAAELGIGVETVKTLLGRVYAKLGVNRRTEAALAAVRMGLL